MAKKKNLYIPGRSILGSLVELFTTLIERFGWPGAVTILIYSFVQQYATLEQKRRLIEIYLLSKNCNVKIGIALGCFVILYLLQAYHFRKLIETKQGEIDRLSAWRNAHQEKLIDTDLHHTKGGEV